MDRDKISQLAHADHPVNSPLDDESVRRLLRRTVGRGDAHVLDLGCGEAAWLLRTLVEHPDVTAVGVDNSAQALAKARKEAAALGVERRLVLQHQDAAEFASDRRFDAVLSVGAAHAFGGLLPTLDAARGHLAPGGLVLVGDAYWEREPTTAARELLGEYEDLATTVDRVVAHGWTPVFGHISTRQELDDFEWCHTGSLATWALDHPDDPDSADVLDAATTHRSQWLRGYRDSFGFLTLVLRRTSG
ncbi:methyltransferase domain-containing protein [Streptomyces griseoviridis]|uniref:SAM-dependent methyltransferase n=1 Tax=Streptomyces griseoviridis TaxID=45398 RepID=UPI00344CEA7A